MGRKEQEITGNNVGQLKRAEIGGKKQFKLSTSLLPDLRHEKHIK